MPVNPDDRAQCVIGLVFVDASLTSGTALNRSLAKVLVSITNSRRLACLICLTMTATTDKGFAKTESRVHLCFHAQRAKTSVEWETGTCDEVSKFMKLCLSQVNFYL